MSRKIHLIYLRLPNRILERDDEVVADLGDIVVAKSRFEGMLAPLRVNGVEVIKNGYAMIYFAFVGRNYDVLKVYDEKGNFKGLYIDVLAYTKREGNTLEMLDLFLDLFVFPGGGAFLLDEDELEMALNYGVIDRETFDFAYRVAREILEKIKRKEFPPDIVWEYDLQGTPSESRVMLT
ncbi:DUF402 domain-containing protein [Thermococcus thioreducens]|uniref:DUF402 domain-containing protein n=1 Tax=Thermococcus thioreducens TaxID=277988 RepID=A0A0Q2XPF1_9EURY|nr:DUF402 domain-containing protein [Thermococcus thioreducens]ASJ12436.1 hypothetical protein A3L14_05795 [Thermococcus thioreducens]KQH83164.1 hypothetical protein AMR53_02800 [Thermococcus thioreducens]SEV90879.1 hypothetical protein SAMN05216170_0796 [Thermococcus thioreducens]